MSGIKANFVRIGTQFKLRCDNGGGAGGGRIANSKNAAPVSTYYVAYDILGKVSLPCVVACRPSIPSISE